MTFDPYDFAPRSFALRRCDDCGMMTPIATACPLCSVLPEKVVETPVDPYPDPHPNPVVEEEARRLAGPAPKRVTPKWLAHLTRLRAGRAQSFDDASLAAALDERPNCVIVSTPRRLAWRKGDAGCPKCADPPPRQNRCRGCLRRLR